MCRTLTRIALSVAGRARGTSNAPAAQQLQTQPGWPDHRGPSRRRQPRRDATLCRNAHAATPSVANRIRHASYAAAWADRQVPAGRSGARELPDFHPTLWLNRRVWFQQRAQQQLGSASKRFVNPSLPQHRIVTTVDLALLSTGELHHEFGLQTRGLARSETRSPPRSGSDRSRLDTLLHDFP